ncbi:hypothetical protein BT96DRAFT_818380 [Gymnopus androsaceus JB14]|uniref:PIG-P domain-containing protein n=1 Tax=Gymnopus androsaceus JB14 TaxID=1447944 RepID=A0A6A4HSX6_9AGAR|nr:hypothetical protein BT96DRAFT_818380 [Gymnopus androsaceus JB14]
MKHSLAPKLLELFVVYLLWALLPDPVIISLGIEWYPNREWSILLPAWSMVLVLLTYFSYMALTLYGTPAFDDVEAVTFYSFLFRVLTSQRIDSRAQFPPLRNNGANDDDDDSYAHGYDQKALFSSYARHAQDNTVPELYDIPIELVNRVLYTKERKGKAKQE